MITPKHPQENNIDSNTMVMFFLEIYNYLRQPLYKQVVIETKKGTLIIESKQFDGLLFHARFLELLIIQKFQYLYMFFVLFLAR